MRIFVDFQIENDLKSQLISDNVIYRPDIELKSARYLQRALFLTLPDVLITRTLPDEETVSRWRQELPNHLIFIICIGNSDVLTDSICKIPVHHVLKQPGTNSALRAFILAEQVNNIHINYQSNFPILSKVDNSKASSSKSVITIGAGVLNLITTYYLNKNGYKVKVYDACSDPRNSCDQKLRSCTHGGDDARMFSLSETRHHLAKSHLDLVQENINNPFQRRFEKGGWLTCDDKSLSSNDFKWITDFEDIPAWLPTVFEDDLISFTQESEPLWQEFIMQEPELFTDVGYVPKVLRLYSTKEQYEAAIVIENRIGSTKKLVELQDLIQEHPALRESVENGEIVGAIEIVGFTVNIHKFSAKLIGFLEESGVEFNWDKKIEKIERNTDNVIVGVSTKDETIQADHYVISPGAYGGSLLSSLKSHNQISSIVGSWLRLPNLGPKLDVSLKISRSGFASDSAAVGANILVGTDSDGQDIIHVSSGHGYVGENPDNIDPKYIEDLFRVVEETAKRYFPECYYAAKKSGLLEKSLKCCVRPWTPSGLGIFEIVKADNDGLLILTGGHNTGGFAQSPSVAMAVLSALQGEEHSMHRAYHPNRISCFTSHDRAVNSGVISSGYSIGTADELPMDYVV